LDIFKLLQEGDATGLEMQKALEALDLAKSSVEQAKERYELTKNYFEQVIARADEAGIPRAKFKKLVEERIAGLWNSGLIEIGTEKQPKAAKPARPAKKNKTATLEESAEPAPDDMGDEALALTPESATFN
jgi:hypothetical protein